MRTRILIAAAVLIGVAGCGGEEATTTTGPPVTEAPAATTTEAPPATTADATTPTTPEATPVDTRCHTSELAATFTAADAGAGNRYSTLTLTNKAQRTCTVYGYGGLQPLDAAKKQLPITLSRNGAQGGPKLVTLAPGQGVSRTLHWNVVRTGTAKCPEGVYAEIIPPDETDPLLIPYAFGEICGGKMDGTPFGVKL